MPLPLYYDSLDTARRQDDVMLWRNSLKENIRCKNAIEKALAENFDGMYLKDGIISPLAVEYGTDRLTWVLANTVKEHMEDGRFRPANKEWADGIYVPKDRRNYEFSVSSHPEIVNGLITDYRQYLSDVLHQYGAGDCLPGSNHDNYEHQLLILNPFLLHEDYKHGDYQLFYATSGNGCDESNIGRKVFGRFLKDDEHTHFYEDAVNHNVCFVGKDDTGTVRHLHKRATNPLSDFKGNITGSDADYAFHYTGKSDRLYVFEAPIDLLAFLTLYPAGWQEHSYVALCSTADHAALRMLKDYPQLKQVYLCLDHDSAGIEGAYRIADSIHSLGEYQVYRLFPAHKDWDEDLKARMGKDAIPAGEHPKLAYITEKTAELKEMCLEDTDEYIKYKRMPADLFDDTMRNLERLKKQIIASDLTEKKESCAAKMAKTAVAFCVLRSRQIGKPVTAEALADQMAKLYKPHRDKQNISAQLDSIGYDLKEIREDADKSDAQTKTEIEWQIKRMLLLGLSCLQLGGSISLSPTVAEPTVGQAISY